MAANLAVLTIRSVISVLLGSAHLYFVILCFAYISTINPLPLWLTSSAHLREWALLIMSVSDLLLHLLLAVPVVTALLYLQGEFRRYHLCLLAFPILGLSLHSLWRLFAMRHELSLSYLSYVNALIPAIALLLVGVLALKHFSHIQARTASSPC